MTVSKLHLLIIEVGEVHLPPSPLATLSNYGRCRVEWTPFADKALQLKRKGMKEVPTERFFAQETRHLVPSPLLPSHDFPGEYKPSLVSSLGSDLSILQTFSSRYIGR